MPRIIGPRITKTVHVPAHDVKVFDEDAYWHLDWQGNHDDEDGTFLYAKVAYPTVADAQNQHRMMALAREQERVEGERRTRAINAAQRAQRKARRQEQT